MQYGIDLVREPFDLAFRIHVLGLKISVVTVLNNGRRNDEPFHKIRPIQGIYLPINLIRFFRFQIESLRYLIHGSGYKVRSTLLRYLEGGRTEESGY